MSDPEFETSDGLASIVLIGELMDQLMEAEVLRPADKRRIVNESLLQLGLMGTPQSAVAHNLIIDAIGAPGRKRR